MNLRNTWIIGFGLALPRPETARRSGNVDLGMDRHDSSRLLFPRRRSRNDPRNRLPCILRVTCRGWRLLSAVLRVIISIGALALDFVSTAKSAVQNEDSRPLAISQPHPLGRRDMLASTNRLLPFRPAYGSPCGSATGIRTQGRRSTIRSSRLKPSDPGRSGDAFAKADRRKGRFADLDGGGSAVPDPSRKFRGVSYRDGFGGGQAGQ